jgi:predicted  nucleic acid-binding Zn-ribbon protein
MKDDILDQAITASETLMRHLYTLQKFVTETGKLDDQYKGFQRGIEGAKAQIADLQKQTRDAEAQLATITQQHRDVDKELATLNSQVSDKRSELKSVVDAIDQFKAMLRAA